MVIFCLLQIGNRSGGTGRNGFVGDGADVCKHRVQVTAGIEDFPCRGAEGGERGSHLWTPLRGEQIHKKTKYADTK